MSNRNTPKHFALDFVKCRIIGTKTSLKKAQYPGSTEYEELCELMEAHPRFKVAEKKIKRNTEKKTYKNLDYDFIEKYISIQSDSDVIEREYEQVKQVMGDIGLSSYPHVKRWFLKKFSTEDKPFDMAKAREELIHAGLAAAPQDEAA